MLTQENVELLTAYFDPSDHEFLQGRAYITESAITTRIELVDPSWSFAIMNTQQRDEKIIVTAALSIQDVTRDNIGMAVIAKSREGDKEINEPEKAAATDALKRCARLFGIGRYLLTLPSSVRDESSLAKWMNGSASTNPISQRPDDKQPPVLIEDVVITHWVKATPDGRKYHVLKTVNHGNISIWTRKLFREAAWIDENDWEVIGSIDEDLWIPVNIQPDGEHWEIVEVAQCTLDDIPL